MLSAIMLNVTNNPFVLSAVMLSVIMLSVVMLRVVMLSVVMLSVVMLSVVILNVIMLSVVAPINYSCKKSLWYTLTTARSQLHQ
jgi:hypothetical protein